MNKIIRLLSALLLLSTASKAQLTLTTDSVLQTSTCAGGNVIVPYTVTGGNFNFGNVFTAQLSDMWGSFANPVNIGTMPFLTGSGIIFAKIPANTNFGFLYRVRVIASNPKDTGSVSPNTIIITQVAQLNQILTLPNDTICQGDTATLTAVNIATSYSWSTGDTTRSIKVTQPGIYSVTTEDMLKCKSTTSDTVYVEVCNTVSELQLNSMLSIYPVPATNEFSVSLPSYVSNEYDIYIYDTKGDLIYYSVYNPSMHSVKKINCSSWESGMYQFVLRSEKVLVKKKIAVIK